MTMKESLVNLLTINKDKTVYTLNLDAFSNISSPISFVDLDTPENIGILKPLYTAMDNYDSISINVYSNGKSESGVEWEDIPRNSLSALYIAYLVGHQSRDTKLSLSTENLKYVKSVLLPEMAINKTYIGYLCGMDIPMSIYELNYNDERFVDYNDDGIAYQDGGCGWAGTLVDFYKNNGLNKLTDYVEANLKLTLEFNSYNSREVFNLLNYRDLFSVLGDQSAMISDMLLAYNMQQ